MIAFADESGDPGCKYREGSSEFFIFGMVCFDEKRAREISRSIDMLRARLGYSKTFEFHFRDNSHHQRIQFLSLLKRTRFELFAVAFDKKSFQFTDKKQIYRKAITELASLSKGRSFKKLVLDEIFGKKEYVAYRKYIKEQLDDVGLVKQEPSKTNNLIQVADYSVGIINRILLGKSNAQEYFDLIRNKSKTILIK